MDFKILEKEQRMNRMYFKADIADLIAEGLDLDALIRLTIENQRRLGFDPKFYSGPFELKIKQNTLVWSCYYEKQEKTDLH